MHYLRSITFVFESKKWPMNILVGALAFSPFLPLIGALVYIGYLFEMLEHMHRRGRDVPYLDFDFNRLMKYLIRGVYPFLVSLVIGKFSTAVRLVPDFDELQRDFP